MGQRLTVQVDVPDNLRSSRDAVWRARIADEAAAVRLVDRKLVAADRQSRQPRDTALVGGFR